MANIFYQSILLETIMHYTLCTASTPMLVCHQCLRRGSEALLLFWLYGLSSVLFLCDKLIFKKQKTTKNTTTVYRLKKKITAFYTTEILSQDFAKQELGSSYFFAVDGESSVVSPHEGECTNLGALPSILYIFIILIVQSCIIFCSHHVQSVYVFHFNFFNTKRGSIYLQVR